MKFNLNVSERKPKAPRNGARRHDGPMELLRSRSVQALLLMVASGQVIAVAARPSDSTDLVELDPVVVTETAMQASLGDPDNPVAAAWRAKAMERESEQVAMRYRSQGFQISNDLERKIHVAALEFEIDPAIAFGLIRAESSFRNAATSPVGAVGLTQLMPRTAAWMEPGVTRTQLRDPETNLRIGFKYDGNEDLALLAYNRGPGTVDRAIRRGANPDNGYAKFVRGDANHGHRLYTRSTGRR
jgi:soluble lytic murein transglycosylase-like protein